MIDLLRMSRSRGFSPGDQVLYRRIATLTGLSEAEDPLSMIDVPCGRGAVANFFAENYPVDVAGVDPDPAAVEVAESRARNAGLSAKVHYQGAPVEDLPYKDEVFDLSVGELGLASSTEPLKAVRELGRVTRPGGHVVLIALHWTGHVDEERRRILVQHLGAAPLVLVEWKQALREANVDDLQLEDWSDQAFPFLIRGRTFTRLAELSTLIDKVSILQRAWGRWGWRGLKGAIKREYEIRSLLGQERTIGVTLITGKRVGALVTQ
ncbi:MAG: methyltransferase domain-containing protein [Gemmatimonadetes bacterium]|uniref:Methyltransferase domain-containing protein n=1 Tax=Candidatus Kutchimonas denitrificans TaxID=3056748 RepID=A0AAE5C9R5_9BACT|nr:methyltransferase domain-containing protein [Gemmatimonadota bacterium]NIR73712.1 methyltransferase domain-containing protein [Candidatus Kutchimonas denitrificans]NIS00762.1 methyltransferase domain-containing protein [Gemmatimonadota bacterium]NIT66349.1 methyltransferase domain-containing protein [Gemmatimonadota bacterium]NIU51567.1 methyltransferase domain-containing protein [Gemmatimonadota bacterium]